MENKKVHFYELEPQPNTEEFKFWQNVENRENRLVPSVDDGFYNYEVPESLIKEFLGDRETIGFFANFIFLFEQGKIFKEKFGIFPEVRFYSEGIIRVSKRFKSFLEYSFSHN